MNTPPLFDRVAHIFRRNAVLEAKTPGLGLHGSFRLIYVDPDGDDIFLFPVWLGKGPSLSGKPLRYSYLALARQAIAGAIEEHQNFELPPIMWSEATVAADVITAAQKKWETVAPLIEGPNERRILIKKDRRRLILARAVELSISAREIDARLARVWFYGAGYRSFLPVYCYSGGRKKERLPESSENPKRGRKPLAVTTGYALDRSGVNVTADDIKNFITAVNEHYIAGNLNIAETYSALLQDHYKDSSNDPEAELKKPWETPTERQFRYWFSKWMSNAVLRAKVGEDVYPLKNRPLPGTARDGVRGAGDVFDIDATIANIYLVSSFDRRLVIGKPVVYLIVDRDSNMIVGLHVALEGPSWNAARFALFNAFTPKGAWLRSIGIEDGNDEMWPCQEVCNFVYSDRGEILSENALASLTRGLGIHKAVAPRHRPDLKALVERKFGTIPGRIEWLAGGYTTRQDGRSKDRAKDAKHNATYTLREFTKLIALECIFHNQNFDCSHLLTDEMRADDVAPNPTGVYQWSLRHVSANVLHRRTPLELYITLLPSVELTVQPQGIKFHGSFYHSERLLASGMMNQSLKTRSRIKVFYDLNNPDHLYWWEQGAGLWDVLVMRESDRHIRGQKRLEEILDIEAREAAKRGDVDNARRQARHQLTKRQQKVQEDAERRAQEIRGTSGHRRQNVTAKNIDENRALDRAAERSRLGREMGPTVSSQTSESTKPSPAADDQKKHETKVINMIDELMQRKLKKPPDGE